MTEKQFFEEIEPNIRDDNTVPCFNINCALCIFRAGSECYFNNVEKLKIAYYNYKAKILSERLND